MLSRFPLRWLLAQLLVFGCEVPPANSPAAETSTGVLLPYRGPIRGLFDDSIDAEVFGAPGEGAGSDPAALSDRVRASGVVFIAVVTTVTDENGSISRSIELELSPVERPFSGSLAPFISNASSTLRVQVNPRTLGYALLRTSQSDLIGKRIIVFLGRFEEDNGATSLHWHGAEDSPSVRQAVVAAASMADLEK